VGETRVDLLHLLEDLRDAYPGALEETILTEIVANALDSSATRIELRPGPPDGTLTVVDDGSGMRRRELARYHDVAASTKARGEGIGFAGVGIKLGLLVCEDVTTETRRGTTHVATSWRLASRHRAPWQWVPPPGLVAARGTAVRLRPTNPLSPLVDPGFVEAALRRHFEALVDPAFATVLAPHYPRGVRLVVGDQPIVADAADGADTAPLRICIGRQRKPSASGYLLRAPLPLPEDRRGLGVSTFGKVIRRGWDWLGLTPATPERIGGLIEVPALAECLTLNKADFLRSGPRGAMYLAYRRAIQEAVSQQLAVWGDARDTSEEARRRVARPLERDLERVVTELADDFPLLGSLVQVRPGGQQRLPIGRAARVGDGRALVVASVAANAERGVSAAGDGVPHDERESGPRAPVADITLPAANGERRPSRYGLAIEFEERMGDGEPGRLVESTVWVNTAHPAYGRAVASRSEGYHVALAAALALARVAVEPAEEHAFLAAFLARWGEALEGDRGRRPGRR